MFNFKEEHCSGPNKPPEYEMESSPGHVYIRRNFRQVTVEHEGMEPYTEWVCEMARVTIEEFNAYAQAKAMETQNAMDETLAEILLNQLEV